MVRGWQLGQNSLVPIFGGSFLVCSLENSCSAAHKSPLCPPITHSAWGCARGTNPLTIFVQDSVQDSRLNIAARTNMCRKTYWLALASPCPRSCGWWCLLSNSCWFLFSGSTALLSSPGPRGGSRGSVDPTSLPGGGIACLLLLFLRLLPPVCSTASPIPASLRRIGPPIPSFSCQWVLLPWRRFPWCSLPTLTTVSSESTMEQQILPVNQAIVPSIILLLCYLKINRVQFRSSHWSVTSRKRERMLCLFVVRQLFFWFITLPFFPINSSLLSFTTT